MSRLVSYATAKRLSTPVEEYQNFPYGNERSTESNGLDLLNPPTESSEEFVTVNDDTARKVPVMAHKGILEFVRNSKNIINADSEDENEMNNAASVFTLSKMRNFMKNVPSYLDADFNAAFTPRLSASNVKRRANQRLNLGRDEVSDWLDAQR
ncbi:hypothetical protein TNCV_1782051 [Trichonephila clavipes]|nr:hypothetical protein TNCV_1782051 [Trichonephila clavipes]